MATDTASSDAVRGKPSGRDPNAFPLDEKLFKLLREQDLDLVKLYTGIQDNEQVKTHIINIQKEAYPIMPYQCIRFFSFAASRIHEIVPIYDHILKLGKDRDGAIFLDVGTCFGTDLRKVVTDGWDAKNVVATDINPGFWAMGHKLFHTDPASFPPTFVPGNALSDDHLQIFPVLPTGSAADTPRPDLPSLASLNPLRGHVSAIYLGIIFHLFPEQDQVRLARGLAGLLSPQPGSVIAGWQPGAPQKGEMMMARGLDDSAITQFLHSPETWKELWDGEVFEKGTVKVEADLVSYKTEFAAGEFYFLRWSVMRV